MAAASIEGVIRGVTCMAAASGCRCPSWREKSALSLSSAIGGSESSSGCSGSSVVTAPTPCDYNPQGGRSLGGHKVVVMRRAPTRHAIATPKGVTRGSQGGHKGVVRKRAAPRPAITTHKGVTRGSRGGGSTNLQDPVQTCYDNEKSAR
eukprot:1185426-Prorocentrum_minimum.AAC.3